MSTSPEQLGVTSTTPRIPGQCAIRRDKVPGTFGGRSIEEQSRVLESTGKGRCRTGRSAHHCQRSQTGLAFKAHNGHDHHGLGGTGKARTRRFGSKVFTRASRRVPKGYLAHLLSHQSGVRGYADEADVLFSTQHYATSREALKTIMGYPLMFEPGAKVEYSSLSFTVLGAAAEAATRRSFQQLSADFFSKHGVSGFALDDSLAIVPKRVRGYLVDRNSMMEFNDGRVMAREYLKGTDGEVTLAHVYDISNRYPAGGFDASAEDLLRFVIAVASGKVLKPETVDEMWTAQRTSDGTKSVFGLGWGVSRWKEKAKMVGMNGAELSTTTFLRYLPESGVGVALLCNAEGAQGLSELLNDILNATMQ